MYEERPVIFTVSKLTSNFGGLFNITTKDPRGSQFNREEVGIKSLFTEMLEISEDVCTSTDAGCLFEID